MKLTKFIGFSGTQFQYSGSARHGIFCTGSRWRGGIVAASMAGLERINALIPCREDVSSNGTWGTTVTQRVGRLTCSPQGRYPGQRGVSYPGSHQPGRTSRAAGVAPDGSVNIPVRAPPGKVTCRGGCSLAQALTTGPTSNASRVLASRGRPTGSSCVGLVKVWSMAQVSIKCSDRRVVPRLVSPE